MVLNKVGVILVVAGLMAGCARNWPHEGHGGLAERDAPCDRAIDEAVAAVSYLKAEPGLRPQSNVSAAEDHLIRARRESQAGLYGDAAQSYDDAIQLLGSNPQEVKRPRPFCTLRQKPEVH
jgi:cytochrome c-type biogenesis protein CcmH/NrfG